MSVLSFTLFFSALRCSSLKISLFFSFLGFSRGFLGFNFSNFVSSSLVLLSSPIWFPARKTQVSKWNAAARFPAKKNCPNTQVPRGCPASPYASRQTVRACGWTYADVVTSVSCMDRFSKKLFNSGAQRSTMGKTFWKIFPCENFVMKLTYAHPPARTDCRGGGGEAG